jgi:hypothetical protein
MVGFSDDLALALYALSKIFDEFDYFQLSKYAKTSSKIYEIDAK